MPNNYFPYQENSICSVPECCMSRRENEMRVKTPHKKKQSSVKQAGLISLHSAPQLHDSQLESERYHGTAILIQCLRKCKTWPPSVALMVAPHTETLSDKWKLKFCFKISFHCVPNYMQKAAHRKASSETDTSRLVSVLFILELTKNPLIFIATLPFGGFFCATQN